MNVSSGTSVSEEKWYSARNAERNAESERGIMAAGGTAHNRTTDTQIRFKPKGAIVQERVAIKSGSYHLSHMKNNSRGVLENNARSTVTLPKPVPPEAEAYYCSERQG